MTPPATCPYYGKLTALPCFSCPHYLIDADQCSLASIDNKITLWTANSRSYADRWRDYERERDELLKLSKEALVDLIIHRPTPY